MEYVLVSLTVAIVLIGVGVFAAILFRRVVDANMVHVVVTGKKRISYGKDEQAGNVYYEWPSWVPGLGITKTELKVSNFDISLNDYDAYDKERLPFVVDIVAFFRVVDPSKSAERVSDFEDLKDQLTSIVQGSVRTVLAKSELETIMEERSTFGDKFTQEVRDQLMSWGVEAVKNIELMDIRDARESAVIHNIMAKKKSYIEMESRVEVANNLRTAKISEISAKKEIDIQDQDAKQMVGLRTVDNEREVELSRQKAHQSIKDQEKITKEKEMAVLKVAAVKQADIDKEVEVVKAEQQKQTTVIKAEGQKQTTVIVAEGDLEATTNRSKGITLEGTAKAEAEKAMQLAPVEAQIELAKEIGSNKQYQDYLITIRKVEASQAIGIEQAAALKTAQIKVITNSGTPGAGLNNVMDMFSAQGGTEIAAMMEALSNSDKGAALVNKLTQDKKKS